jgi:hypothetical protein
MNQDMLTETPNTSFDNSYKPGTVEHDFTYRTLLGLHEAGKLSVLRVWNTPNSSRHADLQSLGETKPRKTHQKTATVLKTPSKRYSRSCRHPSAISVVMIDSTSPSSVSSSMSSDSVYEAHTPSNPASPSHQLLEK